MFGGSALKIQSERGQDSFSIARVAAAVGICVPVLLLAGLIWLLGRAIYVQPKVVIDSFPSVALLIAILVGAFLISHTLHVLLNRVRQPSNTANLNHGNHWTHTTLWSSRFPVWLWHSFFVPCIAVDAAWFLFALEFAIGESGRGHNLQLSVANLMFALQAVVSLSLSLGIPVGAISAFLVWILVFMGRYIRAKFAHW